MNVRQQWCPTIMFNKHWLFSDLPRLQCPFCVLFVLFQWKVNYFTLTLLYSSKLLVRETPLKINFFFVSHL